MKTSRLRLLSGLACTLLAGMIATAPVEAQLPGGGRGESPIMDLQRGIGFLQKKQYERAKKHFVGFQKRDLHNALPSYYLALAHAGLGEADGALSALKEAVARGWRDPESWRSDAGLLPLLTSNETFHKGLETLLARVADRRDRGAIDPIDLADLQFTDDFDIEQTLGSSGGKPTALLFVRDTGEDTSAIWIVREWLESVGDQGRVRVLVQCRGKRHVDKLAALERFRDELRLEVPLGISTPDQRHRLRPWLDFPTLVLLDAKGKARGVVDGFPADLEARYEALLARALTLDEEKAGEKPKTSPPKKDESSSSEKPPTTRPKSESTIPSRSEIKAQNRGL